MYILYTIFYITINNITSHSLYSHHSPCIKNIFLLLFTDADKKPVEDLTSLAALNIEDVLSETQSMSRGILLNVRHSWLKEWGSDALGFLPEDMMQELLTGVTTENYQDLSLSITS